MPASALAPLNPFAAELRRAAAGAAAPDKAPSLRELSKISGVGRSAIGDWLAGKSLPRSWDDGAVLVVDAIIKLAARYGKRFPDEEAVRQRCKDAYENAKNPPRVNGTPGSGITLPGVEATADPADAASWRSAVDEPGPAGSEAGSAPYSPSRWRGKYTVSAIAVFAVMTVTVALTLLWWTPEKRAPAPLADPPPIEVPSHPTPLMSAKSGKCVTVDGDADKARALQFGCTDAAGRTWYLQRAAEGTATHLFRIVNASNSKCLSYSDEIVGEAHVVVQRSCASGNNKDQLWNFVVQNGDRGDGWVTGTFVNMRSGLFLDINGESVEDGAPVIQWWDNGKLNQRFQVMNEAVG